MAHQRSMTPGNILSGFRKTGIFPFDRHIFTETDFLPSSVTDRPATQQLTISHDSPIPQQPTSNINNTISQLEPSISFCSPISQLEPPSSFCSPITQTPSSCLGNSTSNAEYAIPLNEKSTTFSGPGELRGYPKAKGRKNNQKGRRKGRSMIATDTPEKNELAEVAQKKLKKKCVTPKRLFNNAPETSSDEEPVLSEHSTDNEIDLLQVDPTGFEELERDAIEGDFVLVEFSGKSKVIYYVGKIIKDRDLDGEYEISYLRNLNQTKKFTMPSVPDLASVHESDIKMILPKPKLFGETRRQNACLVFEVDFGLINLK